MKIQPNLSFLTNIAIVFCCTRLLLFSPVGVDAMEPAEQPNGKSVVISNCKTPFKFGFGSWEKTFKDFPVQPDGIRITSKNAEGGAGFAGFKIDVSRYADYTPVLTVTASESNKATRVNLVLKDSDKTVRSFAFDLEGLEPGKPTRVAARAGASLAEGSKRAGKAKKEETDAEEGEGKGKGTKEGEEPGMQILVSVMFSAFGNTRPIDIVLSKIELVPPDDEIKAEREKLRKKQEKQAEKAREISEEKERSKEKLLNKEIRHPADGPSVESVCAVAPDVLAVTIQSGKHVSNELRPYVPKPGDRIEPQETEKPRYTVKDGRIVEYFAKKVYRAEEEDPREKEGKKKKKDKDKESELGLLSPDGKQIFIQGKTDGVLLDVTLADETDSYQIVSKDDPNYSSPKQALGVFLKGKPNGYSQPFPFRFTISLKLPTPLKENAEYEIRFNGINTAQESVKYVHRPKSVRSLAVHAIQTGYRPDDPYKRAYCSFWMGVDGNGESKGCTPEIKSFELLDAAGKTVFSGPAELAKREGEKERICIHEALDYTKAAVYRFDFSDFSEPGEYRVYVPNLGTSAPLRIAEDVWEKAMNVAMQGVFTQRQAIEFGPPATEYRRPRTFHPDDGVQFYQMNISRRGGQEGKRGADLIKQAEAGTLKRVEIVPGGYQDAGDWDSVGAHLSVTYQLLGLYDLNAEAFLRTKLSLPPSETGNNLPDILDEALWQMPMWKSMQLPDGGVRGGYGFGWGCRSGETSSMVKSAGVYAVDTETTFHYAGVAARTARILSKFEKEKAAEYLRSARLAWDWAEKNSDEKSLAAQNADPSRAAKIVLNLPHLRALAAVELLAATGESVFDEAYKKSTELTSKEAKSALYLRSAQMEAAFAYARLPKGTGDEELKRLAVRRITAYADHAIEFSRKNSYNVIAGDRTDLPLLFSCHYFSTPAGGGLAFLYAYELTKERRFLAAAVQSSNYCLGANPDNLCYCSGLGSDPQHFNFIIDAQVTGQLPDKLPGHIPYGQGNEGSEASRKSNGWVVAYLLNAPQGSKMHPQWYDWPVNEQYIDFARYPRLNESCFNSTSVPAACYWFYLANRK